jgi:hypothetical protein
MYLWCYTNHVPRPRPTAVFIGEDPKQSLKDICNALNRGRKWNDRLDSSAHQKLLQITKTWTALRSNWNDRVEKWRRSGRDPRRIPTPDMMMRLGQVEKAFHFRIVPTPSGRAYLVASPTGENFRDVALVYFGRLILNPECEKLSGPCLKCGKYYIKKTIRHSVFCSRGCSGGAVQTKRRARLHAKKLSEVEKAIANYRTRPVRYAKLGCKEWILQAMPNITSKFLTRAIHRDELAPLPETKR